MEVENIAITTVRRRIIRRRRAAAVRGANKCGDINEQEGGTIYCVHPIKSRETRRT